jgi:hypothetical protein
MGEVSPLDPWSLGSRRLGNKVADLAGFALFAPQPTFVVNIPTSLSRAPHLWVAAALTPFVPIAAASPGRVDADMPARHPDNR